MLEVLQRHFSQVCYFTSKRVFKSCIPPRHIANVCLTFETGRAQTAPSLTHNAFVVLLVNGAMRAQKVNPDCDH